MNVFKKTKIFFSFYAISPHFLRFYLVYTEIIFEFLSSKYHKICKI